MTKPAESCLSCKHCMRNGPNQSPYCLLSLKYVSEGSFLECNKYDVSPLNSMNYKEDEENGQLSLLDV